MGYGLGAIETWLYGGSFGSRHRGAGECSGDGGWKDGRSLIRLRPNDSSLRCQFAYSRIPVAERGARPAATSKRGGLVLGKGAGLSNVFGSNPDGIAVCYSSAVVAPAVSSVRADEGLVGGKSILGAKSGGGGLNAASSHDRIHRSVSGSGEVPRVGGSSGAEQSEGDDAPACRNASHCAVGQIVVREREHTLLHHTASE